MALLSAVRAIFFLLPLLLSASVRAAEPVTRVRGEVPGDADNRWKNVIGKPDEHRTFDLEQTSPFRRSPGTFSGAKGAKTRTFQYDQKVAPKSFDARTFSGTKDAWVSGMKFATKDAPTSGRYEIPGVGKAAPVKTAATKDARESTKTVAVREMPGANREYRGPEADKLHKPVKPEELPRITNELRELKTIEDVKELLNKNK